MFDFLKTAKGILGINARNHLYVSRYNSREAKKFADNKLYTKRFLQSRHIGVAKLYHVIKQHKELQNIDLKTLPKSFVIKPNRGYGGEGILVINKKKGSKFVSVSGEKYTHEEIFYHCIDILDGKYAISGTHDQVIIEEFLEPHVDFNNIIPEGLPDLRILVFNYVPIIGMLRVPTKESHGKANLHLGAIGIGIDMGTGKTTYGIKHNRYIRKFANGEPIANFLIPHWNEILEMSSRIQQISKIGYLAVDLAITKTGVKVLEVNARAGLSVQVCNRAFLKARLEKVADLKVVNPAQGVEVAKTLFSNKVPVREEIELKPVIGLYEPVLPLGKQNQEVIAKINPHGTHNLIDKNLAEGEKKILEIMLKKKRIKLTFKKVDLSQQDYKIVLAGKYLGDYLLDFRKPFPLIGKKISKQEIKMLENFDEKITEIDSKIHILSALKPLNLQEEKTAFLNNPNFSPQFIYKSPKTDFTTLMRELDKLPNEINHPLFPLYKKKVREIKNKIGLVGSLNKPIFTDYSSRLYGNADQALYHQALAVIKKTKLQEDESVLLKFNESVAQLESFLKKNNLSHWKIKILEDAPTDMQVNKNNTIFIRKNSEFTANRLAALITHEIETHIYRFENGKAHPFGLLKRGTAGYLTTEEGLAVYNQNKLDLPFGQKVIWPALNVVACYHGMRNSFLDLFHLLKRDFKLSDQIAWKLCLKIKRGLYDTSKKLAFTKDIVYFKGEKLVEKYLSNSANKLEDLYIGKIGIDDLKILKDFQDFKVKYLPERKG